MSWRAVAAPRALYFGDDGRIPNHPHYPALLYRGVLAGEDLASAFEQLFEANAWPAAWRDTIYPYQHYHTQTHEVVAIARGHARLLLGGDAGETVEVVAGDALVLPAGSGHRCLQASADLLVVGAYPRDAAEVDTRRAAIDEHPQWRATILATPLPLSDPVGGVDGALARLWTRR